MDLDAPSDPLGNGTAADPGPGRSPVDRAADGDRDYDDPPERPLTATLLLDRFEALLPAIQREWPEVARHTLEASRGSVDRLVEVIARQTGRTSEGIKAQLVELAHATGESAHQVSDSLRPLEQQLEHLLDELHTTLRPRIEKPVRERPLLALAVAAGVGLFTGLLLASARRRP